MCLGVGSVSVQPWWVDNMHDRGPSCEDTCKTDLRSHRQGDYRASVLLRSGRTACVFRNDVGQ